MKIGAIIQARMTSQRLPGKSLRLIAKKPMLQYLLESLRMAKGLDAIIVATSDESSDDPIAEFVSSFGLPCFRGPLENVAGRFLAASQAYHLDAFVRICGDSPLLDHRIVEEAVSIFSSGSFDIVTNVLERTFPKGQSIEVVNADLYRSHYPRMETSEQREHVTRYFYENAGQFSILNFTSGGSFGTTQLSVDTESDMQAMTKVITEMAKPHYEYGYEELIRLMRIAD